MTSSLWARDGVLVGGAWRPARQTEQVENPATEEVVGSAASGSAADVDDAVAAARAAGASWGTTSPSGRADALDALHAQLALRRDVLVATTVAEVGAPVRIAREVHVDLALDLIASFARLARTMPFEERVGHSVVYRMPAGVVAAITPWNYPLYQLAAKVGAALAGGCTIVAKPAELTPLTAYLLADAAVAAGLPPGVLNLVPGRGTVVGTALVAHPGVDVVSFTGSTAVGRQVAQTAARDLKRACLELGGKSASLLLADADLDAAVRATVDSAVLNTGQTCSAWTRLLVPWARYDEAVEIAVAHAETLVVGDPRDERTDVGPLVSAAQRRSVEADVEQAVAEGARVATGGTAPVDGMTRGHFVRPTVLSGVEPSARVAQREVFGPVLAVLGYRDEDEAVDIANGTEYGLAGAVWSADPHRALAVARRLRVGQVDVNGAPFNPEAPFGGWKSSGSGRELGRAGIEEFCQLVSVQR
ncbi:MAG TPA: aldehyde dehydrogenase family protein [Mycobacteriales bacterium]